MGRRVRCEGCVTSHRMWAGQKVVRCIRTSSEGREFEVCTVHRMRGLDSLLEGIEAIGSSGVTGLHLLRLSGLLSINLLLTLGVPGAEFHRVVSVHSEHGV